MADSNVIKFDPQRRQAQIQEHLRDLRRSIDKELARFSSEEGDRITRRPGGGEPLRRSIT